MENSEKIQYVKVITEETDTSVISVYLEMAKSIILSKLYPYETDDARMEWLKKYDMLQCRIASYMLNKRGAEGEKAHSENGISRTYYDSEIPKDLLNEITPFARVL